MEYKLKTHLIEVLAFTCFCFQIKNLKIVGEIFKRYFTKIRIRKNQNRRELERIFFFIKK